MSIRLTPIAMALLFANAQPAAASNPPPFAVMTAVQYQADLNLDLSRYWFSEKLDGIRAIWDGKQLMTRTGRKLTPPTWFIADLPDYPVEGELWAGRGRFELVQQTVLEQTPVEAGWQQIRFMLFDLPKDPQDYAKRYQALQALSQAMNVAHIEVVEQQPITSHAQLMALLDAVASQQGEGLMLRRIDAPYFGGRSDHLIKLKKHQDAEATVIGYKPGKGKLTGVMGALLVKTPEGASFYLGGGFSDEQRRSPPEMGQTVTYRFNGYTASGLPKFARFVRVREE